MAWLTARLRAHACVRSITKTLMKQTASLHRVLSELLPAQQRDAVFVNVCATFRSGGALAGQRGR